MAQRHMREFILRTSVKNRSASGGRQFVSQAAH